MWTKQSMPNFKSKWHVYYFLIGFAVSFLPSETQGTLTPKNIRTIFQFGDSISDTGNAIRIPLVGPTLPAARPPYGETFPGFPSGRWSDGRIIIDFEATAFGLPLLTPVLETNSSTKCGDGINFAFAGSPALDLTFFALRGIRVPSLVVPLSRQIALFEEYITIKCPKLYNGANVVEKSLIFFGEIGDNDINYAIVQGKTIQQIRGYIPSITAAIVKGIKKIIRLGAKNIVVPGNFARGCFPYILNIFNGTQPLDNDGCVKSVNELIIYQNQDIQDALNLLRTQYPGVTILYADYYNSFLAILRQAPMFGFEANTLQSACCGSPPYNLISNVSNFCGSPGVPLCPDPNKYIFWDGIHLTQEAYRRIFEIIISSILPMLMGS